MQSTRTFKKIIFKNHILSVDNYYTLRMHSEHGHCNPCVLNTIHNLPFKIKLHILYKHLVICDTMEKRRSVYVQHCYLLLCCIHTQPFHYLMAVYYTGLVSDIEECGYRETEPVMKDNPAADVYHFLCLSSLEGKASKHNESRSCLQHTAACRPALPPMSPW